MLVQIDLIRLDRELAAELQPLLGATPDPVRVLDSLEEFTASLTPDVASCAVIAVKDASRIAPAWVREVRARVPAAQIVVACRVCSDETWRRLILSGCTSVLRPPFAGVALESEFDAEPVVSHIFHRHPSLHEHGKAMFRYTLPSDAEYIPGMVHIVSLLALEYGFSPADCTMNLPLALDEALSNAIVHGNRRDPRKRVEVEGMIDAEALRLKVRDEGEGFQRESARNPVHPDALLRPSGRGLFLIESVMDEVRYTQDGRCIEMIKRRVGSRTPS